MSVAKIYDINTSSSIIKSLSLCPNNKKSVLQYDNLKNHSGYMQWNAINNMNIVNIDVMKNKSSIMLNDEINEGYNILESQLKLNESKKIHNECQDYIFNMIDEFKNIINKNPSKYQAQLIHEAGFDKKKYKDNNRIGATLIDIMISQCIIEKVKEGNKCYFTIINDKPYTKFDYIECNSKQSKLEALLANHLIKEKYDFIQQYKFKDCVHKKQLPFDFRVTFNDTIIYVEVDGRQHYEHVPYFHKRKEDFELQQKRDYIKDTYMKTNELNFMRIRYDQDIVQTFNEGLTRIMKNN
jgi:hypothetical protein